MYDSPGSGVQGCSGFPGFGFKVQGLSHYLVLQTDVNPKAYSLLSPVIPLSAWSPKPRLYIA